MNNHLVESDVDQRNVSFAVDAALLFQLGEQLVARHSVALAELVKNAYDADATEVTISFESVSEVGGAITVSDDGNGMTADQLVNHWMRVATTQSVDAPRSPKFGRRRTGEKGVGRFACRRLGTALLLSSNARSTFKEIGGSDPEEGSDAEAIERVTGLFDWTQFEAGKDLDSVGVDIQVQRVDNSESTGLELRIDGVRDKWTDVNFAELERDLLALVSPFGISEQSHHAPGYPRDPGFKISVIAPEFPERQGELSESYGDIAWATLSGRVDDAGQANYTIDIRDGDSTSFKSGDSFDEVCGARFTIYYFSYQREFFQGVDFSVGQARELGNERGGVRIYLDGFRVFPYGNPGDDWLDLDLHRGRRLATVPEDLTETSAGLTRPMLLRPGNNQLIGYVDVSRDLQPGIIPNVSRERLLDTEGFGQLKKFVRLGVDWATIQYARSTEATRSSRRGQTAAGRAEQTYDVVGEVINWARAQDSIPESTNSKLIRQLERLQTSIADDRDEAAREASLLRVLASAGTSVLILDHTIKSLVDGIGHIESRLGDVLPDLPAITRSEVAQIASDLHLWRQLVDQQAARVGLLLGRGALQRRRSLVLRPIAESLIDIFAGYTNEYGIKFDFDIERTLRTPTVHQAELYAVLLNALTNSFKAVLPTQPRRVHIHASRDKTHLTIHVRDTGIGISDALKTEAFKPFVSDSELDERFGLGTGIGLKIVSDIILGESGTIAFTDPPSGWSTQLTITLPY